MCKNTDYEWVRAVDDRESLYVKVVMVNGDVLYANNIGWNAENDHVLRGVYTSSGGWNKPKERPIDEVIVENGVAYWYYLNNPIRVAYWSDVERESRNL